MLFPLAWLLFSGFHGWIYPWFTVGLLGIAVVSFRDDLLSVSSAFRLFIQVLATTFCFIELSVFDMLPWWGIIIIYLSSIFIMNAYNFMDGINGITCAYSLAIIIPLSGQLSENGYLSLFDPESFFAFIFAALLVFGYFNFRKRAICFGGDVGSVSLGYLVNFMVLALFLGTWRNDTNIQPVNIASFQQLEWKFMLLLAVYGVDSLLTIFYRLVLRENIFQAHRKHLFQYLANGLHWPHLLVASLYAVVQLAINLWILRSTVSVWSCLGVILLLSSIYLAGLYVRLKTTKVGFITTD